MHVGATMVGPQLPPLPDNVVIASSSGGVAVLESWLDGGNPVNARAGELEVTMLRTEAEVLEAERRTLAKAARKYALGCSPDLVSAVVVDGHPDPAYNGRYEISETSFRHRRALVNEHGNTCRRQKLEGARQQWTLQPRDQDRYVAWIDSPDGPLPTGAHTWECWDPGLGVLVPGSGPTIHGGWAQHTLTVTIEHK